MLNIIERYIISMTKDDVNNFALKKGINLSEKELDFTYNFIKKNYKDYFANPKVFNMDLYKNEYTKENFSKLTKVYEEYINRYANYL